MEIKKPHEIRLYLLCLGFPRPAFLKEAETTTLLMFQIFFAIQKIYKNVRQLYVRHSKGMSSGQ